MIALAVVIKALQHVSSHLREGHPVRSYVRHGKEATRRLFEHHHSTITNLAWQSIRHQQRLGVHFDSVDDAYQAAMEAPLLALRHYSPTKGPLENYVRRAIKYALLKHIAEERARGFTGIRTLYDRLRMATTEEAREKIVNEFPKIKEIQGTEPTPSIEEMIEGSRELLHCDEVLDDMKRELGVSLQRIRDYLSQREKRTWKKHNLTERKLTIYQLKAIESLSFREIAKRLGVDVGDVYRAYKEIARLVQEAREKRTFAREAMPTAEQIRQWRLRRLLFGLGRLRIGVGEGFPPQHIKFVQDVLVGLLVDLGAADSGFGADRDGLRVRRQS